jgi:hypothetical protein
VLGKEEALGWGRDGFYWSENRKDQKNSGRGGANEHGRRGEAKQLDEAKRFFMGI